MKILHFYPWSSWGTLGGTEKYIIEISQYLSQKHQVSIVYPLAGNKNTVIITKDKYQEIALPDTNPHSNRFIGYGIKGSNSLKAWENLLSTNKFDIVHFHCYEQYQLMYVKIAHKYLLKTVFTPHVVNFTCVTGNLINGMNNTFCDGEFRINRCNECSLSSKKKNTTKKVIQYFNLLFKKWNLKTVVTHFDKLIVLNQNYFNVLIKNKIQKDKLVLIRPQVLSSFKKNDTNEFPEELKVIYIGRLSNLKGLDSLVEAFRRLNDKKIVLHIYGPAGDIDIDNYVSANIHYEGTFQFEEIASILSKFHVLVLPSISYEMMPLVVQEAINSGLYIVGSDVPGITEIMEQGVNGKIIPRNSIDAIVDALSEIKDQFKTNDHVRVESFEELSERINEVYEDICN